MIIKIIRKKYLLNELFNFNFIKKLEVIHLSGVSTNLMVYLPSYYFFKFDENNSLSLLFLNKFFYKSFLRHFKYNYNGVLKNYKIKLRLKGLGFRIIPICKLLYSFFFNYSNFIYFHIPNNLYVKSYKKKIFLVSPLKQVLKLVFSNIMNLKKVGPYYKRGFLYKRHIIILQKKTKVFL